MRFACFSSTWHRCLLNDCVIFLDEQRKPIKEIYRKKIKGQYPYYGASGIIDNINSYIFDDNLILLSEDGANILDRNYRVSFIVRGKIWVNNHAHVLKPKNKIDINYLSEYLENLDYAKYNTGSAQPKLNQDVCKNIIINIPDYNEQQKIGKFLSIINQRIDTQNKIIKKYKSLKKIISYIFKFLLEVILLLVPSKILKIVTNILKLVMTIIKEVKNMVKRKNFYEISNLWKEDKRNYIKKSSYSAYLLLLENHLLPFFGKKTKIEEKDVQQFVLSKLNDGLSQKSIKDIIIVLKMIVKFGVKQKLLDYTDIEIKFPSDNDKSDLEVLTKQDHKKILDYLEKHFTFKNLGIYICLSTGMRIGEVCGLRWSDMDCENGIIKVCRTVQRIYVITENDRHTEILVDTPKTKNSIRDIPMTSDLLKIMKPIRKVVNEDFYVITNENKPTEPRTYRNYYKRLLKRLQINELKFHGLRHSFATRCIESKCDYKTVSVILGHANISTTLNLYVHPNLEQKKRCVNQMFKSLR